MRVITLLALAAAVAGCGSDRTYSSDEVKAAFAEHGYTLVLWRIQPRGEPQKGVFVPEEGQRFTGFVVTDSNAADMWDDYESQSDDDSFDARRANVVVISDGGLSRTDRRRIVSALEALPERGAPVLTIEAPD